MTSLFPFGGEGSFGKLGAILLDMVDLLFFVLLAFPTGCFSISSLRPKEAASASSPSTSSSLSIPDESVKIKFRKAFVRPLAGLPGSIPMSMWAEVDTPSSHSKLDAKLL